MDVSERSIVGVDGIERRRASDDWLKTLDSCNMWRCRMIVRNGGKPMFLLADGSQFLSPEWVLVVEDEAGTIHRVTTKTAPFVRKLTSIRQVYQVARGIGLKTLSVPVHI